MSELNEMLTDGEEIAVVDTRELGDWVSGHISPVVAAAAGREWSSTPQRCCPEPM